MVDRTIKCLKRLLKRSIDDNLRQLVLIRQDRVLVTKVLASLQLRCFGKKHMAATGVYDKAIGENTLTTIRSFFCENAPLPVRK